MSSKKSDFAEKVGLLRDSPDRAVSILNCELQARSARI